MLERHVTHGCIQLYILGRLAAIYGSWQYKNLIRYTVWKGNIYGSNPCRHQMTIRNSERKSLFIRLTKNLLGIYQVLLHSVADQKPARQRSLNIDRALRVIFGMESWLLSYVKLLIGWFLSRVVSGKWGVSPYGSENFFLISKFSEASGAEKKHGYVCTCVTCFCAGALYFCVLRPDS